MTLDGDRLNGSVPHLTENCYKFGKDGLRRIDDFWLDLKAYCGIGILPVLPWNPTLVHSSVLIRSFHLTELK